MQFPELAPIKPINLPELKPIGTEAKKQSLQEWHAAGGGVPKQYKGREHVWHAKVKKFAEGGEARMGAGGLLKGIVKGAQKVLPAAERDANLAKMLEGSKVKERLYHGTQAHDDYAEEAGQAFGQFTGKPTWLAKEPYTASGYSAGTGSTYPVHAQVKKPLALRFDANDKASKAFPVAKRFGVDVDHMISTRKPESAWEVINDPAFVDAVEAAGHDGLSITEDGYQTYGVFDPRKIKSATGNRGTYDVSETDINKAKGGEVHMAGGGDRVSNKTLSDLIKEDAGVSKTDPRGEMKAYDPTIRERMVDALQRGMEGLGGSRYKSRQNAQTLMGGPSSNLPINMGFADIVPFLGTALGVDEGARDLGHAYDAVKRGDYIDAAANTVGAAAGLIPGAAGTIKGAKAAGRGALTLAKSDAAYNLAQKALASPAMAAVRPMNVIKPTGGNFLTGRTEKDLSLLKARGPTHRDEALLMGGRFAQMADDPENIRIMAQDAALNKWVDSNLTNYVKKQMGTPDDPVRKLAEEGITHKPGLVDDYRRTEEALKKQRMEAGFPEEGMGQSPAAQAWERASDEAIALHRAGDIQGMPEQYAKFKEAEDKMRAARRGLDEKFKQRIAVAGLNDREMESMMRNMPFTEKAKLVGDTDYLKANDEYYANQHPMMDNYIGLGRENPYISKLDPETQLYAPFTGDLGFDHIMDVLREDLTAGRIRPEQMNKISMSDAVRRTYQYDQELAAKMNASRAAAREGLPTYKEYPEGYKWIELNKPGAFAQESEAMGHSVRGYEPPKGHPDWIEGSGDSGSSSYGHGGWEAIKSGEAKVYSLVDSKGAPHTTVEVNRRPAVFSDVVRSIGKEEAERLLDQGVTLSEMIKKIPDFKYQQRITQIKGKQNRAPNEDYLPYIQDFVKGDKWSSVGDIQNTGMREKSSVFGDAELQRLKEAGETDIPQLLLGDEIQRLHNIITPEGKRLKYDNKGNIIGMEGEFAHGGAVRMAGGGAAKKVVEGAVKASKKLLSMADEVPKGVLPTAERDANLNKMLEGSKVKERLYHGTTDDVQKFDPKKAGKKTGNLTTALGTFLSDSPKEASRYAEQWGTKGGNVMPVFAQIQNPYQMPYKEFDQLAMGAWNRMMKDPSYDPNAIVKWNDIEGAKRAAAAVNKHEPDALQDVINRRNELIDQGHDAVIVNIGGNKEVIVFDPAKIKSATGNRGTYDITDPDISKAAGGAIHMAGGGLLKSGLKKLFGAAEGVPKGVEEIVVRTRDPALKTQKMGVPNVDFADPLLPPTMRLSEALGNAGAEGKTLNFTEADRSRVFGSNRGGVGFSGLQHYSLPHKKANTVWGFGNTGMAEKKIRQNDPENSLWTTFVGSPTQHRSNSVVIGDAIKEFQKSVKQGVVPVEQIMLMNKRLNELTDPKTGAKVFESGFDLTDPSALSVANTFSRRAAVGDVMLGLGVKGPMARLDFKKEFPNTKFVDASDIENILKRETDPDLVNAGTYDVGNRLFVLDGKIIQRPDLNEAFPVQVTGNDLGMKFGLVPPDTAMRDFYKAREGRLDKNKDPSPVSYYDLARAEPSQLVDENYLTYLQKAGYKKGGLAAATKS